MSWTVLIAQHYVVSAHHSVWHVVGAQLMYTELMHEQYPGQTYMGLVGKKHARREFSAQQVWWWDGRGIWQNILDGKPNVLGTRWKLRYSSIISAYLKSFKHLSMFWWLPRLWLYLQLWKPDPSLPSHLGMDIWLIINQMKSVWETIWKSTPRRNGQGPGHPYCCCGGDRGSVVLGSDLPY